MQGKRGTRARIPPLSRAHIMRRAIDEPRIPRKELAKKLQQELKHQGFDVPEIEVLERMISKYRNEITDAPEDKPWNLLTLSDYDISADALPVVFELWAHALREWKRPLTIREIKWAARLYRIQDDLSELLMLSTQYAAYERFCRLLGEEKIAPIANEAIFERDAELYVDIHTLKPTDEERLKMLEDPEILKKKRQNLLRELRNPEILGLLGLEKSYSQDQIQTVKTKRRQRNEKR